MTLELDAVIDSQDNTIDMKAGLDTLRGVSDATSRIVEGILERKVPERKSHKSGVRTTLKQSFIGSYGQQFSVDILDDRLQRRFQQIGINTIIELVAYFLRESIYQDVDALSEEAQRVVDDLGDTSDKISQQVRTSSLKNVHQICKKFDQDVKIRFRRNREEQTTLVTFNQETARVIEAELANYEVQFKAGITRLNINTGNGRLLVEGENNTVAFGFSGEYREVEVAAKKILSENLNYNNGRQPEHWRSLNIIASPINLPDGKTIKYLLRGIENA